MLRNLVEAMKRHPGRARLGNHGFFRFFPMGKIMWVCLKMLCIPKPNGFADHYPYEQWL